MNKSDSIKELASAFAKAQSEFAGAAKNSANPFFKSKYADLESVVEAIKPACANHGLSYIQVSHDAENAASIETIIMHQSGEWMGCGPVSVPVSKLDAQGFGSAMTYARRYSLSAAFGIAPEDDDANAASKVPPARQGKGVIKPTDNPSFKPDMDEETYLLGVADTVISLDPDYAAAYEYLEGENLDSDEKVWVWEKLASWSALRNGIKKHGDMVRSQKA